MLGKDLNWICLLMITLVMDLSDGCPSEENRDLAIEAAYKFIIEKLGFKPNQKFFGTGPSLYLAAKHKEVGGIILETPFTFGF